MSTPSLPQTNPNAILSDVFDQPIELGTPLVIQTPNGAITTAPAEIYSVAGHIHVRMTNGDDYTAEHLHVTAMRVIDGRPS